MQVWYVLNCFINMYLEIVRSQDSHFLLNDKEEREDLSNIEKILFHPWVLKPLIRQSFLQIHGKIIWDQSSQRLRSTNNLQSTCPEKYLLTPKYLWSLILVILPGCTIYQKKFSYTNTYEQVLLKEMSSSATLRM